MAELDAANLPADADAIKAVTGLLPDGGALTALLGAVAAILADTDEMQADDVPGLIAAVPAATEARLVNAGDGTDLLQLIADKIATDLTDTDATALAIATATRNLILDRVLAGNHDTAGTVGKLLQFLDAAISSIDGTGDVSVIRAVLAGKRSLTDNGNGTKTARFLDTDGVTAKLDLTFDATGQITVSEEDPA